MRKVGSVIVKVFITTVELRGLTALDEDLHCYGNLVDVVICMCACEIVVCAVSSIVDSVATKVLNQCTSLGRAWSRLKTTTTIANDVNDS